MLSLSFPASPFVVSRRQSSRRRGQIYCALAPVRLISSLFLAMSSRMAASCRLMQEVGHLMQQLTAQLRL
jgi:hypothetical protein